MFFSIPDLPFIQPSHVSFILITWPKEQLSMLDGVHLKEREPGVFQSLKIALGKGGKAVSEKDRVGTGEL